MPSSTAWRHAGRSTSTAKWMADTGPQDSRGRTCAAPHHQRQQPHLAVPDHQLVHVTVRHAAETCQMQSVLGVVRYAAAPAGGSRRRQAKDGLHTGRCPAPLLNPHELFGGAAPPAVLTAIHGTSSARSQQWTRRDFGRLEEFPEVLLAWY